ncbi:MAG TPA: DUF4386 domain-containing protein [Egibacteraceae bacterium]|nr:DUF4386 domain-containing protein [Egibacteraceae bacterium]
MTKPKHLARIAGGLYLAMCILGAGAHLGIRAGVRVPDDAAATAANIIANPTLFRFALVADIAMATVFVLLGVALHRLLRHVDRHAAGALVVFVTVGAGLMLTNLGFHLAALLVATNPAYGQPGGDGLVLLLLDLHHHGYALAGIFFGLWLLPLGYLAHTSGLFPKLLGVLLVAAGGAWIVGTLAVFAWPDLPTAVHTIIEAPKFAEFWMVAYLITKGVRAHRADRPVPAAA